MRESEKEKRAKDEVNGQGEKGVPQPHMGHRTAIRLRTAITQK